MRENIERACAGRCLYCCVHVRWTQQHSTGGRNVVKLPSSHRLDTRNNCLVRKEWACSKTLMLLLLQASFSIYFLCSEFVTFKTSIGHHFTIFVSTNIVFESKYNVKSLNSLCPTRGELFNTRNGQVWRKSIFKRGWPSQQGVRSGSAVALVRGV